MSRPTVALLILVACAAAFAPAAEPAGDELLRTDSRAPYIHRITLYDHDGLAISPTDPLVGPYSPRATCGKCHPYDEIAGGWHFNADNPNWLAGRTGEPWFLVDSETGNWLPVSGRDWPGALHPDELGLSSWQFVQRFGHHLPGGSFGAPAAEQREASDTSIRWEISGTLEVDCLICHCGDQQHDPTVAAAQIELENYKWIPTAALGLAAVRGSAAKVPDDYDPFEPPNPDFPERSGPQLNWDQTRFDPDGRVLLNITRRIPNDRCYFCHTTRLVGAEAPVPIARSHDVHLVAGMLCVDCHRNGLDHMIVRGYRNEAAIMAEPQRFAFSCEGCHLGTSAFSEHETDLAIVQELQDPSLHLGGHLGAPRPTHRGLPPLHFEKMTCTACHAGPYPDLHTRQIQTALAHKLGLPTRERTDDQPPLIVGPVFIQQNDGRVAPQRLTWPNDPDGENDAPYHWPLAHDVRPASQSIGSGGCTDCHASDGPLDFGHPYTTDNVAATDQADDMLALREYDRNLANIWAFGFNFRPVFKYFVLACGALIAWLLGRTSCEALRQNVLLAGPTCATTTVTAGASAAPRAPRLALILYILLLIGAAIQATSAFGSELILGEFGGYALLVHMGGAGLFTVGLTGSAILRGPQYHVGNDAPFIQRWMWRIVLAIGLVVMFAMVAAMLPLAGHGGQHLLLEIHELAALTLVAALILQLVANAAARTKKR